MYLRRTSLITPAAALLFCLGGVGSFIQEAVGQKGIDLGAKIRTGQWEPYKIAVADFKSVEFSSQNDSLAKAVQSVIADDLDFHAFFDTIPLNQFYVSVWELKEVTPVAWHRMGADYLIEGKVELDQENIKVEYWLSELSPRGANELAHEKLKTKRQNHRRVAHMIADEAVKRIAAEKPIFTTRIAYVSTATGHKEIYVCDYDGFNSIRLTGDQSTNLSPTWDQKEEKILYTSFRRRSQQIWELDIRSGKSRLISNYPNSNNSARVSPDNKEMVVTLSKDGNSELYVLDRNGEIKRRLTNSNSIEVGASWSPTGNEIAFQSDRSGSPQIYLMDKEGLNVRRLTYEGKYNDSPDYSPRGDVIAFVGRQDDGRFRICTIDINGENCACFDLSGSNENPHWSPDGWHLVYCKGNGDSKNLFIMDRFRKRVRRITDDGKSSSPAWQPFSGRGD